MDDKNMENEMTNGSQDDNKNNDNYEKICYMCRRPESKAGPMISMPGGMCLCHDCMQKAFDTVTKGGMDFSKMPNMPYMNMNFSDLSQMPPVNEIPQSQKLKKKKEPEGIAYNVPGQAQITLTDGKKKLYEGEVPVTQFGIIEYLAPVLFNKNSTIKVYFDPNTGGLLKVDREEGK